MKITFGNLINQVNRLKKLVEYLYAKEASTTQGVAVADATDTTDVVAQFNALLTSLRDAGLIAT